MKMAYKEKKISRNDDSTIEEDYENEEKSENEFEEEKREW